MRVHRSIVVNMYSMLFAICCAGNYMYVRTELAFSMKHAQIKGILRYKRCVKPQRIGRHSKFPACCISLQCYVVMQLFIVL